MAALLSGDLSVSAGLVGEVVSESIFGALQVNRDSLVHMVLIAVIAAVFTNFADVFRARQVSEISFYLLYMLLLAPVPAGV